MNQDVTTGGPRTERHTSLQARLIGMVLCLVLLVWTVAAVATWYDTEHEVGELLDAHLSHAASLMLSQPLDDLSSLEVRETLTLHEYQPRVVLQMWYDDTLVVRSATAPLHPLVALSHRGFEQVNLGGTGWRVFSAQGLDARVVVQVAEKEASRRDVVLANLRSIILPMMLALPFLVFGVWLAVKQSLRPLSQLVQQVAVRQPDASEPLAVDGVPTEVRPLVQALNRLFDRMAVLIESERRFTADAAHELRTPLAGIRMQAQVAQGATVAAERNEALAATLQGCDRAARLVDQLLQLARLENQSDVTHDTAELTVCVQRMAHDLTPVAARRGQQMLLPQADRSAQPNGPGLAIRCPVPEGLLDILLRNLLDNALRYSPDGARVRVGYGVTPDGRSYVRVEDSGPGMSPPDIKRLGERFFRVLGSHQPGSGLGWSIVVRIARLYDLSLDVSPSADLGGLKVDVSWTSA